MMDRQLHRISIANTTNFKLADGGGGGYTMSSAAAIPYAARGSTTLARHSGQVFFFLAHARMHSSWKMWRHAGTSLHSCPGRSSSRPMAHTGGGSDATAALARAGYGKCASTTGALNRSSFRGGGCPWPPLARPSLPEHTLQRQDRRKLPPVRRSHPRSPP